MLSVNSLQLKQEVPNTGGMSCALITATQQGLSGGFFATLATSSFRRGTPRSCLEPQQRTFVGEEVLAIEPDGMAEVFDIQVEGTENFIANGLVSHNTRWNDDDLSGRMLQAMQDAVDEDAPEEEIERWEVVEFPAVAEADEYLMPDLTIVEGPLSEEQSFKKPRLLRRKDEALHEERWPLAFLKKKRRSMVDRHWSALYQQRPVPAEGLNFKDDYFVARPMLLQEPEMILMAAFDVAIGKNQSNDWTVGAVGGLDSRNRLHVLDVIRGRWGTFEIVEAVLDLYEKWGLDKVGIERGQLEMAIAPVLKSRMEERNLYPPMDNTLLPVTDKEKRASVLQGMMQHHRVLFPKEEDAPWMRRVKEELLRFPAGRHDDIVDALAWLARMAAKTSPPRPAATRRMESWKDRLRKHVARGGRTNDPMAA